MKKIHGFLVFLLCISLASCSQKENDIYLTKGGEYASKEGKFVVSFPVQPIYSKLKREVDDHEVNVHLHRAVLSFNRIFDLEYINLEDVSLSFSEKELLTSLAGTVAEDFSGEFVLTENEALSFKEMNARKIRLETNKQMKEKGSDYFIKVHLLIHENRLYALKYAGIDDKRIDVFFSSFRIVDK